MISDVAIAQARDREVGACLHTYARLRRTYPKFHITLSAAAFSSRGSAPSTDVPLPHMWIMDVERILDHSLTPRQKTVLLSYYGYNATPWRRGWESERSDAAADFFAFMAEDGVPLRLRDYCVSAA